MSKIKPMSTFLPDYCWEHIFKFLMKYDDDDDDENNSSSNFKSLSLVSKDFLSITNRLRFSITVKFKTHLYLPSLFLRFPNVTSVNIWGKEEDSINQLLCQMSSSTSSFNLTSLDLSHLPTIPANRLQALSQKIATTLTSLKCSFIEDSLHNTDLSLIADCFPNLQLLDFTACFDISNEGIGHVLRKCRNIRHLNLTSCLELKTLGINNFQVPKLEVLNLSCTKVNDEELYEISKSCRGLLQLLLNYCHVIENGVKHVAENCTQLIEINLEGCNGVHPNVVESMVSSRPSLRKITAPPRFRFTERNRKFFLHHGCLVC